MLFVPKYLVYNVVLLVTNWKHGENSRIQLGRNNPKIQQQINNFLRIRLEKAYQRIKEFVINFYDTHTIYAFCRFHLYHFHQEIKIFGKFSMKNH